MSLLPYATGHTHQAWSSEAEYRRESAPRHEETSGAISEAGCRPQRGVAGRVSGHERRNKHMNGHCECGGQGRRANESRKCVLTRGSRGNKNTESGVWPRRQATDSLCLPCSNLSSRPDAEKYTHPTGNFFHMHRFSPLLAGGF